MALVFPENRESYKAFIRFTLVDDQQKEISFDEDASAIGSDTASASESQIELYLPQGIQVSDKVEYENAGLGFGAALAGDTSANAEGRPNCRRRPKRWIEPHNRQVSNPRLLPPLRKRHR